MARVALRDIDLDAFRERLNSESDRACAILGAALVDAKLEETLRARFRCSQDELLGSSRPLGLFSARIAVAAALGVVSDDARSDLDIIRTVRNDFAHSFDHSLSFDDQSVASRCANLRTANAYLEGFDAAVGAPGQSLSREAIRAIQAVFRPPRWRFQLAVDFLVQYLDTRSAEVFPDAGPELIEQVRLLSANLRVRVRATGHVGDPASAPVLDDPGRGDGRKAG